MKQQQDRCDALNHPTTNPCSWSREKIVFHETRSWRLKEAGGRWSGGPLSSPQLQAPLIWEARPTALATAGVACPAALNWHRRNFGLPSHGEAQPYCDPQPAPGPFRLSFPRVPAFAPTWAGSPWALSSHAGT